VIEWLYAWCLAGHGWCRFGFHTEFELPAVWRDVHRCAACGALVDLY
jgi:hypothetical protein